MPGTFARRGSVLVVSLITVIGLLMLVIYLAHYVRQISKRQADAVDRKRAFYMAEAGLAEAFAGIVTGRSGIVGSRNAPAAMGTGLFWVEVQEGFPGQVVLESHGLAGGMQAQLSLVVQKGQKNVFDEAFFSHGPLEIQPGSLIDGFDSREGSYDDQAPLAAKLRSNSDVRVDGDARVVGELRSGPMGRIEWDANTEPPEVMEPAENELELPEPDPPDVEMQSGTIADAPYPTVMPPGIRGVDFLGVLGQSELVIQGPAVLVVNELWLERDAELRFDSAQGAIELHVIESLVFEEGAFVTTTSDDPRDVLVQIAGDPENGVVLRANSEFHGVVYAPKAKVVVGEPFEIFGALSANQLTFEGPVELHFDRALLDLAARLRLPSKVSWRIVELGQSRGFFRNPFRALGIARSDVVAPGEAHPDPWLEITYYDDSGLQTYAGWESGFDWRNVRTSLHATRDGETVLLPDRERGEGIFDTANDRGAKVELGSMPTNL